MKRQNISSGAKWEELVGYSRAVRVGNIIKVSGTTAVDESGKVVGKNDPFHQACFIFEKIETALQKAGSSLKDVVQTRMYVTDISDWEQIGKAHKKYFDDINPAATMVEVSALIHKDLLVEIEVEAIC